MFAGLRRVVTAKRGRFPVRLKSAAKFENKTYHHFTPIKGQTSAQPVMQATYYYLVRKYTKRDERGFGLEGKKRV